MRRIQITESRLRGMIREAVKNALKESDYNNYFDWAENSGASQKEIDAAGKRHDSRIGSIYDPIDRLANRQRNFNRYQQRVNNGDETRRDMLNRKKSGIKNDLSGGKLFTDRLMGALLRPCKY